MASTSTEISLQDMRSRLPGLPSKAEECFDFRLSGRDFIPV